jgi:outer membrane lipoprotein carrier protein
MLLTHTTRALPVLPAAIATLIGCSDAHSMPDVDGGRGPSSAKAPSSPPAVSPAAALAGRVDALFRNMTTFRARFAQDYRLNAQGIDKRSEGVVVVERPNKFAFRYDPPNENRIVCDGVELKVYVHADRQMLISPFDKTQVPSAFAFLMGGGIASSFSFSLAAANKTFPGATVLIGRPLRPTQNHDEVRFYVDESKIAARDPGALRGVLVIDAQKNRNRFVFSDVSAPASIPASQFTFTPPPGTVVKKTGRASP